MGTERIDPDVLTEPPNVPPRTPDPHPHAPPPDHTPSSHTPPAAEPPVKADERRENRAFLETLLIADDVVIDINENRVDLAQRPTATVDHPKPGASTETMPRPERTRRPLMGMHLRRVRLRSVAKVSLLFFIVCYAALVGTSVVLWNAAIRLDLVSETENLVTSALGIESFDIAGGSLFDVVAVGAGVLCVLGLVITMLLAVVYNVSGLLFGGLAFETAPLDRSRHTPVNA